MRTISMIVLSSVMFILHIMLAPFVEIFSAKIDFIMISILLLAVFSQKWYPPVICAVYSGLAVDITTQVNTYINTGIYLFFAVLLGVLVMIFKQNNIISVSISSFVCVAVKHLFFVFLLYVMRLSQTVTLGTFFYGLPSALYTGVITVGIYFVYKAIFELPFMQDKNNDDGKYII
ncbi:MAG: hypothetical protein E7365_00185 [Clostridiales bacterium]|nr:hypothetical protein [Clostridiales bacterium]